MEQTKILAIISAIDRELEKNGKPYMVPVEANKMLDRRRLLPDSVDRAGLPLRKLLRAGLIPHAYQIKGKWSRWRIPHS